MKTASIVVRFAIATLLIAAATVAAREQTPNSVKAADLVPELAGTWGLAPVDRRPGLTGSIFILDRDASGQTRLDLTFAPTGWDCSAKSESVTWSDQRGRFEWPNQSQTKKLEPCWMSATRRGNELDVRMFCPYTCTRDGINSITLQRIADRRLTPPVGVVSTFCSSPDPLRQALCTPGAIQDGANETDQLTDRSYVLDEGVEEYAVAHPETEHVLLDIVDACHGAGTPKCVNDGLTARNEALRRRITERQQTLARERKVSEAKAIPIVGGKLPSSWDGLRHHVTDDLLPSLSVDECTSTSCRMTIEGETNYTFGYSERRGFCSLEADLFFTSPTDAFAYVEVSENDKNQFGAGEFANYCRADLKLTGDAIDVSLHGTGCYNGCSEVPSRPLVGLYRLAGTPSFACGDYSSLDWIEQNICLDADLAALDRELAAAYAAARKRVSQRDAAALTAAQRNWVKQREECEAGKYYSCLKEKYKERISALKK